MRPGRGRPGVVDAPWSVGRPAGPRDRPGGRGRDDLGPALHEEIERLPDRLRAPVVLCYLEGLTHDQAADHLGCPVGTVRSRLSRGRDRLRRNLARRGFAPSASAPADEASLPIADVPAPLAGLVIEAARLASDAGSPGSPSRWPFLNPEGAFRLMSIHPWKSAAVLLMATGAVAAGLGVTPAQTRNRRTTRPSHGHATAPATAAADAGPRDRAVDDRRFEAIEQKLRDVEARLEESAGARRLPARKGPTGGNNLTNIRPRFDKSLVDEVLVDIGSPSRRATPS